MRSVLRNMGCNFRLLRVLGEGSNGVAALFDIFDQRTGARKRFVVKGAIPPATLTNEKAIHDVSLAPERPNLDHSPKVTSLSMSDKL